MKTSQEWQDFFAKNMMHHTSYPVPPAEFIEMIQRDALSDPLANATDQQELEMARSAAMNERIRGDQLHDQLLKMREKWLEARKHLRAANKGAERNSVALNLAVSRASSVDTITRRYRDHEEKKHETIVWNWLLLSDDDLAAKIGFEPITIIACRKLLKAMLSTRILKL
jgi:hypothetical protein